MLIQLSTNGLLSLLLKYNNYLHKQSGNRNFASCKSVAQPKFSIFKFKKIFLTSSRIPIKCCLILSLRQSASYVPPSALPWQFWFVGVHFWLYQQSRHKMIVQFTDIIKGRNIV